MPKVMKLTCFFITCLFFEIKAINSADEKPKLINENVYSNVFVRRREEQKILLQHFRSFDSYEKKYKLLEIGLNKIIAVVTENQQILLQENYSPAAGFPKTDVTVDAVALTLENTCLFGDLVLHMPELSYKILKKQENWLELMNKCLAFSKHFFKTVVDNNTQKMLSLFDQEINPDKRSVDYVNPYYEQINSSTTKDAKKLRKKTRKGPQLGSKTEL